MTASSSRATARLTVGTTPAHPDATPTRTFATTETTPGSAMGRASARRRRRAGIHPERAADRTPGLFRRSAAPVLAAGCATAMRSTADAAGSGDV
jgi:hypothetical protein